MQNLEKKLQRNIPKLYFYSFFQAFLIIIPIIVPFWQKKGLTLQEVFLLQGIFGAALIILDLPAGYLADIWGRKITMIVGSIITALGFQILWFGNSFTHFAIYELILGIGMSLQSGCDVAILYNSLDKLNLQGKKTAFLGGRASSQTVGEGIASLLGGFLAGFALEWPAYANAITAWIPVLVALTLYEPEGQKLSRVSHRENFRMITKALFGHSKLLTLVILNLIFYGFATYCAVWSMQPYWESRGLKYSLFGYIWAANSFLVAIVSRYAHKVEKYFGSAKVIVIISLLPVIGYLGMGLTGGIAGILFAFAFPICRGLTWVVLPDAINTRVPAEMRATTNSVGSLGMRALFLVFGPLIGHILDTKGPDHTMVTLGYIYIAGIFFVAVPLLNQRKEFI